MTDLKNKFKSLKIKPLIISGILLLFLAALLLLWTSNAESNQSSAPTPAGICFEGEYRIADGPWTAYSPGRHIPSTKGDVTLHGNFYMISPENERIGPVEAGIPIAFFLDHINVTIHEKDSDPYVMDNENPIFGSAACGVTWIPHSFSGDGSSPVYIVIRNPHRFGNETAVDELLSNAAIWSNIDFERSILSKGDPQRNIGILFAVSALVLLGTASFSTLIHIKNSQIIWLLGLTTLFAGAYCIFSAPGISFRYESVISGTTVLGLSMIFYMLFISAIVASFLSERKKIGSATVAILGAFDLLFILLPMITDIFFYDTWLFWVLTQTVANAVLLVCMIRDFISAPGKIRLIYVGTVLPLISFELDAILTALGHQKGGTFSKYVFTILFLFSVAAVTRIIPHSANVATKAKALEAEKTALDAQLAESRISTMMSQIRPHFIYNTLGSIEQLCELDPKKAGELVHNFAKYLRGNFGELDNPKPIRMSKEMEHVRHYISIENVRFPDMTFTFEMNSVDFSLPALTIQPIVENAIKHGLMKLQKGGSIRVISYETDTHYCVSVEDDGVGFDTEILLDNREHVGIRNIRGRLEAMVGGRLDIESTPGVGTKVLISIPKEANK